MVKKFIIRYSPKFKGTQKLKSFKPIEKKFTEQATSFRQEAASKIARRCKSRSLESWYAKSKSYINEAFLKILNFILKNLVQILKIKLHKVNLH